MIQTCRQAIARSWPNRITRNMVLLPCAFCPPPSAQLAQLLSSAVQLLSRARRKQHHFVYPTNIARIMKIILRYTAMLFSNTVSNRRRDKN